jgi:hypothetical protein
VGDCDRLYCNDTIGPCDDCPLALPVSMKESQQREGPDEAGPSESGMRVTS